MTTKVGSSVLGARLTLVTPVLGTPTSGDFSTGTFTWPTFNQSTSGTAAGLSATLAVGSVVLVLQEHSQVLFMVTALVQCQPLPPLK